MNKKIIRVSDAIPEMPASFDAATECALNKVCKKDRSETVRIVERAEETGKPRRTRWERVKKVGLGVAAAALAVLALGIVSAVAVRGLTSKRYDAPMDAASPDPVGQHIASAEDAITEYSYRVETRPSFEENTEPNPAVSESAEKISEALLKTLETTPEETVDIYVYFRSDGIEEAISEQFKAQYPELYNAYMYTEWNEAPQVQTAIEARRQIAAEYYTRTNRERLNAVLTDGKILFLSAYSPMCIVNLPTVMVEGLSDNDEVFYLDLFEDMTSTPSAEGENELAWLQTVRAKVTALSVDPEAIRWTTELRIGKNGEAENPFTALIRVGADEPRCRFYNGDGVQTEDAGAKLVDFASPGSITASEDETDWVLTVPSICALPQLYDAFPGMIPPSGEVTVTQKLFFADRSAEQNGEPELPILLGRMEQSFTFDAEKLLNVREPSHIAVPLSGDAFLTVHTGTGYRNEHVSLDDVTLDAEIRYTRTGVFVIVSIKDIGDLSEAQQDALLQAMNNPWDVNECMLVCADGKNDQRMVYHVSRAFWGTTATARFEITVLPEEYASTKTLALDLHAVCVVGEAGGERNRDWHWDSSEGSLPELMTEMQHLASFTVPLADVGSDPIALQPAPVTNSADVAADALCLFVDGDQEYKPFENWVWSDQDDGLQADGMSFLWKIEEVKDKIPWITNPMELTVRAGDGVSLEPQVNIYDAELKTVAFGVDISTVRTLDPGTYYVSQRVSRREEGETSGYECVVRVVIGGVSGASSPASPEDERNPKHNPMICYHGEVYGMHSEERPDAPGENATFGTVTSVISISEIPERDEQANFGSVGMRFAVTNGGLVVWYNNEWRLFVAIEFGHEG